MVLAARLPRAEGLGASYIDQTSVAGPASYVTGGFAITTGLSTIDRVVVSPRDTRMLAVDDTVYAYSYTVAGGVITVIVYQASTVGAGPNAWAEVAAAVDLSAINFDTMSVGEP